MKRILITTLVGLTGLLVRSENRIVAGNDASSTGTLLSLGEADFSGVTAWIVLRDGLPVKAQVLDDVTHGRLRIKYSCGLVLVFR